MMETQYMALVAKAIIPLSASRAELKRKVARKQDLVLDVSRPVNQNFVCPPLPNKNADLDTRTEPRERNLVLMW